MASLARRVASSTLGELERSLAAQKLETWQNLESGPERAVALERVLAPRRARAPRIGDLQRWAKQLPRGAREILQLWPSSPHIAGLPAGRRKLRTAAQGRRAPSARQPAQRAAWGTPQMIRAAALKGRLVLQSRVSSPEDSAALRQR
eukprot:scaffold178405_cov30-Tisochrysis_lutea.AAC.4